MQVPTAAVAGTCGRRGERLPSDNPNLRKSLFRHDTQIKIDVQVGDIMQNNPSQLIEEMATLMHKYLNLPRNDQNAFKS